MIDLGGQNVLVRAVADPGDADRGVDDGTDDPGVSAGGRGEIRAGGAGFDRGDAVHVAAQLGRGLVDRPAHLGDAAHRAVFHEAVPRVVGEVLAVGGLAPGGDVLLLEGQPGHPHRLALGLLPAHGCPVQRHALRIGAELEHEVEGRRSGPEPVPQVGAQVGGILVGRHRLRVCGLATGGHQLVLDEALGPEGVGQHAPVGGRQDTRLELGHLVEDLPGDRVGRQVRLVVAVDDAGPGELAHVLGGVDEEDVVVLQQQVLGAGPGLALQQFRAGHVEQLDTDAEGGLQVGTAGHGVAGEADPGGQPAGPLFMGTPQEPEAQVGRQVGIDGEHSSGRTVRLEEHRPFDGVLAAGQPAALAHVHEHLFQRGGRVLGAARQRGWPCRVLVGGSGGPDHAVLPSVQRTVAPVIRWTPLPFARLRSSVHRPSGNGASKYPRAGHRQDRQAGSLRCSIGARAASTPPVGCDTAATRLRHGRSGEPRGPQACTRCDHSDAKSNVRGRVQPPVGGG